MKASNYIGVLARVYLGISFFFSDHGNAQPNEAPRFLKFALKNGYSWYQNLLNSAVVPHAATFARLKAPLKRVCSLQVPIPYSPVLENHVFPDRNRIVAGIREVLQGNSAGLPSAG